MRVFEKSKQIVDMVTVDTFGAYGDGVHDDTIAFVKAIKYCNDNNRKLYTLGKKYLVTPADIDTRCSIDFCNAEIIVSGNGGRFLNLQADSNSMILTHTDFTKDGTTNSNLFGKSFHIKSPLSMGIRSGGSGGEYFYNGLFVCDENGKFITKKYNPNLVGGNYELTNIIDVHTTPITIENAKITMRVTGDKYPAFCVVQRNNATVRNMSIHGSYFSNVDFGHSVIYVFNAFNIRIENIVGCNLTDNSHSAYVVQIEQSDTVHVKDCALYDRLSGSWGSFDQNFSDNVVYENCVTQRLDAHYMSTYNARNCTVWFANFSNGYGNIVLENCKLMGSPVSATYSFYRRTDFPHLLNGKVILRNCELMNDKARTISIKAGNEEINNIEDFNFNRFDIILENTVIKNSATEGIELTIARDIFRKNTYLTLRNVTFETLSNALRCSYSESGIEKENFYPLFVFDNVSMNGQSTNAKLIQSRFIANTIITNCLFDELHVNQGSNGNLVITNNILSIIKANSDSGIVANNVFKTDFPVKGNYESTPLILNNNLIVAETNNYAHEWNVDSSSSNVTQLQTKVSELETKFTELEAEVDELTSQAEA